ncbi:Cof-type HAD-IIB family hydrolase [Ectobacillus ponti]|uniref:Cof-type HAD-IIB family hydrolase n=1 Tax=Ectobacillus ponti TaxID=2961894 RepID=A0AA42BRD3_9BACI|nr:Cof-type HAD-IIB family hydrolase [Ectobacillus ponti]MCP8971260.1 Cof-type HAD-IIB family hydrolase [Ectobacillus ponti]
MKLIAIDMDGTLLNGHLEISEENLAAIAKAKAGGHIPMICSGRAKDDVQQVLDRYSLQVPIGASNGAVVYADGRLLQALYISKETAGHIAETLEGEHLPFKLYTNKGIRSPHNWKEKVFAAYQVSSPAEHGFTIEDLERITEHQMKSNVITFFTDVRDLLAEPDLEIEKFFIFTLDATQRAIVLQKLEQMAGITVTASGPTNLEIMHIDGHKGTGLRAMAKHLGIAMEDTVAIGDNFNDVPMLQAAGFSIAMGNAEQAVKDLCDAVTLTNAEHGVAHALEKYILQEAKQS